MSGSSGNKPLSRKPTITVEDNVSAGLYSVIGQRRISRFLNDLARPHVTGRDLAQGYRTMAAEAERECEAAEWIENIAGDMANGPG